MRSELTGGANIGFSKCSTLNPFSWKGVSSWDVFLSLDVGNEKCLKAMFSYFVVGFRNNVTTSHKDSIVVRANLLLITVNGSRVVRDELPIESVKTGPTWESQAFEAGCVYA